MANSISDAQFDRFLKQAARRGADLTRMFHDSGLDAAETGFTLTYALAVHCKLTGITPYQICSSLEKILGDMAIVEVPRRPATGTGN